MRRLILADLVAGFDASSQTPAIEDLMARNVPVMDVLRLLCLQSLVGGGLKPKEVESLRKQFLQVRRYLVKLISRLTGIHIWLRSILSKELGCFIPRLLPTNQSIPVFGSLCD